jgi:hypothetical protein
MVYISGDLKFQVLPSVYTTLKLTAKPAGKGFKRGPHQVRAALFCTTDGESQSDQRTISTPIGLTFYF